MSRFPNRFPKPQQVKLDPLIVAFPGEEPDEPTPPAKPTFIQSWGPSLGAAFLGAVLTWFLTNPAKLAEHPRLFKTLLGAALAVGLYFAVRLGTRKLLAFRESREHEKAEADFIAVKERELRGLLTQFRIYVSNNDIRSLRNILRSATPADREKLGNPADSQYAENWAYFIDKQLELPSPSTQAFWNRSAEFTSLVNNFMGAELLPVQRIVSGNTYSDGFVNSLEQLRDEFNAFLRDLEKWSSSVQERIQPQLGYHAPNVSFARINPFRRNNAAGA